MIETGEVKNQSEFVKKNLVFPEHVFVKYL